MPVISKYYLDEDHKRPLKQYCEDNDYPYAAIVEEINILSRKEEFSNKKSHEIVNIAIKNVLERKEIPEWLYNYIITTCETNNLDKDVVFKYIDRKLGKGSRGRVDSVLVSNAVGYAATHKYFLSDGVAVDEVCDENGWVKCNVNRRIALLIGKNPNKDKKLIADEVVNTVKEEKTEVYMIDNVPLKDKCKEAGIDHRLVIEKYKKLTENNKSSDNTKKIDEKLLKNAFDSARKRVTRGTENVIDGLPLQYFCSLYGYPYNKILIYKYGFSVQYPSLSNEEHIRQAIEYYIYIRDNKVDIKNEAINNLLETDNPSMVCYYCKILGVSFKKALELISNHNLTYYQAVTFIYYFSDDIDKEGHLTITEKNEDYFLGVFKGVEFGAINKSELSITTVYRLIRCNIFSNSNTELEDKLDQVKENLQKLGVNTSDIDTNRSKFDCSILLDYQIDFIDEIIRSVVGSGYIDILKLNSYREVVKNLLMEAINNCSLKKQDRVKEFLINNAKEGFKNYINSLPSHELTFHPTENKKEEE